MLYMYNVMDYNKGEGSRTLCWLTHHLPLALYFS